jgi:hypothetical protein
METIVYVKLLDEGVNVYKPVPAKKINKNTYKLEGMNIYDPLDEKWKFPPESYAEAIEQCLDNENVLVAINLAS